MDSTSRKTIGLALGGGVARGLAHIGVLSVLEEAGIPIDYVAGTSAGSLIGATFCAGLTSAQIKEIGLKIHWWHLARPIWPRQAFVTFDPLARWLAQALGDLRLEDLKTPYAAVATDLQTGQPVTLDRGRLAPAVQASCAVPGIVQPVIIDGRVLGDGSLSDTIPVDVLRRMGADYVIGVDIFPTSIRRFWGPFGMGFNALEILVQRAGGGIDDADCLISPALSGKSYLRFSKKEEYYRLGREAALLKLDSIREQVLGQVAAPASA